MTVGEWVRYAADLLSRTDNESPQLEAQMLAAHVVDKTRSELLAHPEWELDHARADQLLRRRMAQEPLAYILSLREFYSREFVVSRSVLIPRHETETLIEAFFTIESAVPSHARVLDVGTGSGIIAITLKLERPKLRMSALDISEDALAVARENARRFETEIDFYQSDLFSIWDETEPDDFPKFDVIVSNPPYISTEYELPMEVKNFEPHEALFAGDEGDEIYISIAETAGRHIDHEGFLLLEVGFGQAPDVIEIFDSEGWDLHRIYKDLSGVDRVLAFTYPE